MRRLITILLLGVMLAACAGQSTSTFSEIGSGLSAGATSGPVEADMRSETTSASGELDVAIDVNQDRKVIRQAHLDLQADDTRDAYDRIVKIAETAGGFVANANVYPADGEDGQPQVTIVLRIPSDRLSATIDEIKGVVQDVVSESTDAQDVTEQYIDLQARLKNLTALEVELRALLEEVRKQPDADPDKLLRVFSEISNTRGQIEQIQGQINYLDNVVDLASIDISLAPTPAVVPIVEDTWRPLEVARDSLRSLVRGLQNVAEWGIGFALYALPMLLLVAGIPLLALFLTYRWWRRRRPPTAPAIPAETS
ncbi:MAG: DUF4349 domain-containing protein [Acidimicrobiia bacterium]